MATGGQSYYDTTALTDAAPYKFGIVVSQWHADITDALQKGCSDKLIALGAKPENIILWKVPGSFELVYGAKKMITSDIVDVIIVIGTIIRGETAHFDYVSQGLTQGIKDLNVLYDIPIVYCVLTDNNKQQSIDRSGGSKGNKGTEAAVAALQMVILGDS